MCISDSVELTPPLPHQQQQQTNKHILTKTNKALLCQVAWKSNPSISVHRRHPPPPPPPPLLILDQLNIQKHAVAKIKVQQGKHCGIDNSRIFSLDLLCGRTLIMSTLTAMPAPAPKPPNTCGNVPLNTIRSSGQYLTIPPYSTVFSTDDVVCF